MTDIKENLIKHDKIVNPVYFFVLNNIIAAIFQKSVLIPYLDLNNKD